MQAKRVPPCLRVAVAVVAVLLAAAAAEAAVYEVDPVHSSIVFHAKRMGVVYVYGRFDDIKGSLDLAGEDLTEGRITLEVATASVNTGNERRDNHLRSPDFLNSTQIPTMSFVTASVRKTGERAYEVSGKLTLHGVTRDIVVPVEHVGTMKDPRSGATLIGFDGELTVRRSDYGMSFMLGPVSDEIGVHLAVQAIAK